MNTTCEWRRLFLAVAVAAGLAWRGDEAAAARQPRKEREATTEEGKQDYKAYEMLTKGRELLEAGQEERAVKLLSTIPDMFPKSKVRFQAILSLGKYYSDKRQYDLAIKQFRLAEDSEDPDEQAEAIYQGGICYYSMNNFDKAFVALRKVTSEFPWSVYANEAYYYIGQCHFKLGRWAKAVEALQMVGTSVPPNVEGDVKAEAGQRLFVKVYDKDLVVLMNQGQTLDVELSTAPGDREKIVLTPLGRTGEYYLGSIAAEAGKAVPGDGRLQVVGNDKVVVSYTDQNTESGERMRVRTSEIRMVSTATAGFTDGAYREYVQGLFGDSDCFIRVRDADRDSSDAPDKLQVRLLSRYRIEREETAALLAGVPLGESGYGEDYEVRDSVSVVLTEDGPHSGVFVGTIKPEVIAEGTAVNQGDSVLSVMKGDAVLLEYYDESHMLGPDSRVVKAEAKVLVGEIQDVKIEHRVVDSVDLKARKDLIEAKIFLKLGEIFKEVGLMEKAREKADQGLDRVEDVISTSLKASLDRAIVEEAFSTKWDLLLVQDRLNDAIRVCRTLTQLFPDSTMVDRALLRIGQAKMAEERDTHEAITIFNAIVNLPKSELKAEAQYHIALVHEKQAEKYQNRDLSRALLAYKKCAETYPESPFAGESLDKIVSFYINARDYRRAIEIMEQVCQDYPDASFLDNMLWKWVVAAFRIGNYQMAKEKSDQLLADYPNSPNAEKVQKYQEVIQKKLETSG